MANAQLKHVNDPFFVLLLRTKNVIMLCNILNDLLWLIMHIAKKSVLFLLKHNEIQSFDMILSVIREYELFS